MANIKDFIKKIGNETVSLEEQQKALAAVEQTIVEAKAKREESIGKNVDLVISALKKIESDLEAKLVELNNTPAKQGVAGPKGEKGRDGRDGVDGYKGQDGKDGVDGQDGKDGADGISVTDAKVDFDGSLVITLSDGREIDAGTVLSVDAAKHIHSVQTGGTGSTSQAVLDAIAAIQATLATYGTMATQNANAVAITGGNINNTVIGGTTPAAGTFTTITGQTEVLKGTGQNLLVQSSVLTNASWLQSVITVTGSQTDPFGGTTAALLNNGTSAGTHQIAQAVSSISSSNLTYTFSVYAKAGTANYIGLYSSSQGAFFNLTTGAFSANIIGAPISYTSTNTGLPAGWWRVSITVSGNSGAQFQIIMSEDGTNYSYTGTSKTVTISSPQLEFGTTANAYQSTTSAIVYGTPSLSFNNAASVSMDNLGNLAVSPAGTGALQAQATTSSTVGGNARGANAVDWQTSRSAASAVATASNSVINGGYNNTAGSYCSGVGSGYGNYSSGSNYNFIGGGYNNSISGSPTYAFIGGGASNSVSGLFASIVGGASNASAGYYNFIGGGFTNSGTSSSAVTTQSGTMNATTAVTLSGSNANIKVGQYITGTSIAGDTYVAAVSGTSLTLSKVASGSSTSTLSFYTPHGIVVGGGNNQATGSYSFIGGGGDAGTAGQRNTSSGDWSAVVGGAKNISSGAGSFIGGGGLNSGGLPTWGNTASGLNSSSVGGQGSAASGNYSFVGGGLINAANSSYSAILGGTYGTTRGIVGNQVFPACNSPIAGTTGISQAALLILAKQTTDATATVLTSDGSAAGGSNQVILPNNSAYYFKARVIAGVTGAGDSKAWTLEGAIKRGSGVGTAAIVGTVTTTVVATDAGAATWTVTATADTTNGGLKITVTGQASTTIRWVCKVETAEMTY